MMQLFLIHCFLILLLALSEKAASNSSCFVCPPGITPGRNKFGSDFTFYCRDPPTNAPPIQFYVNDTSQPLDLDGDTNLGYRRYNNLQVHNVTPAYEGVFYCQFDGGDITPHQCLYVLGIARFASCSSGSCELEVNAMAGENVTLHFDIAFENGGCKNQGILLKLSGPGFPPRGETINPSNYVYNPITKTRHVQRTLVHVNHNQQGPYEMQMLAFNDVEMTMIDSTTTLSIRLTVRDPPATSMPTHPSTATTGAATTPITAGTTTTIDSTTEITDVTVASVSTDAPTTAAVTSTTKESSSMKPAPQESMSAVVAGVVVAGAVIIVVVIVSFLIVFVCKRSKTAIKPPIPETSVLPPTLTLNHHSPPSRKKSDSTTTESNTSSNLPNLDTSNSVRTLETEETVTPPLEHLQLGNGVPLTPPSDQVGFPSLQVIQFAQISDGQHRAVSLQQDSTEGCEVGRYSRHSITLNAETTHHCTTSTSCRGCRLSEQRSENRLDGYTRERLENWREDQDSRMGADQSRFPDYPDGHYCTECRNRITDMHRGDVEDRFEAGHGSSNPVDGQRCRPCVPDWQRNHFHCRRTDSICSTGKFSMYSSPDDYNNFSLPRSLEHKPQIIHI